MTSRTVGFLTTQKPGRKARTVAPRDRSTDPTVEVVTARLAKLSTDSMPWLSKDLDLSPPSGRPEQIGPDTYKGPAKRR